MNTKRTLIGAFIIFLGLGLSSFKDDDRNFQISKNLDIFNSIFKELDLFYVDTIDPEKMIQNGVNGMLALTDPYTEYYPEEGINSLKEMITGSMVVSELLYDIIRKKIVLPLWNLLKVCRLQKLV